ncbi:IS3 family transposase [Streptomyces sp. AK02-04a]|uniref:IS3 family transposase n=1 Tax=Streptomyces TaxID=1883 RepID=UPI0039F53C3E
MECRDTCSHAVLTVFTHEITAIHVASRQTHGVPRTHAELRRVGQRVNRERVARVNAEGTG